MIQISETRAFEAAKNFRKGARELSVALTWAVGQVYQGNADALTRIFAAAGLSFNDMGEARGTKTGSAVMAFLRAPVDAGGCGLAGLIRWDDDTSRFKMAKGWLSIAEKADFALVYVNASRPRGWLEFQAKPAAQAFNLDAAILRLFKRAEREGVKHEDIVRALKTAIAG